MGNFSDVWSVLWDIRYKWRSIGRELGLREAVLENIEAAYGTNFEPCLQKMITEWIKLSKATWDALIAALKLPTVGEEGVADDIAKRYSLVFQ